MRDLLDDDLAELYPVRPADDVRLARLREQLFSEQPKRRTRRWIGIAAAAAGVVLVAGLVVYLRPASHNAPVATMPTAPATSLVEAAGLLETSGEPRGKYRHIKYEVWQTYSTGEAGTPSFGATQFEYQTDVWLPVAPSQNPVVTRRLTGRQRAIAGVQKRAEDYHIYKDDKGPGLWDSLCTHTPCHEVGMLNPLPVEPAEKLDSAAKTLMSPFTTNQEKAGLYRQLAAVPEIRYDNGTVTTAGPTRFTLDPATGEVVSVEERKPNTRLMSPDLVTLAVTITYEWTDQRPS
ncbi:hypothetical protein UK23_24930 [Lentzea aerocolonigenes]|uniref:Uncharacterized protein n=1 Tax=Lentzea aerocolonigenes TaxID=68170 RepID=A0A0F0GR28_LENAE|nr:hypothetical protein [Lentzea aerocolonigenes]KJK45790.1 hypothetical protein UK23_24930 [Lentzea aerocolonigenes]